ncbi:amino acid deaminase [Halomonas sp. MCCC 1A17488]|uniref:amino acid deaminase n=1 Tax=unclassified Halomonas TaxID=2609666 RepID=UPI0018D21BEC|nr:MULTISPECIES: amino acid deaminase [unclassified Halomonas]MCE8017148.1 amino acid deaminase [Halomonas sp. MCCC 1A17488]MCG3240481.1 amino acid deaminase [Halomonas sp. MCCC 1A17488]QPP49660.1 amino acid deaminase [Halomonas sp. SS10-MC5]
MNDSNHNHDELHKGTPQTGNRLLADVSLPAAVIHEPALAHNLAWMQRFCDAHGARLAPHGKTTMCPELFQRQLAAGAWGITLATAVQCRAAFRHGVNRLLMANQLVGEANMAIVAGLLEAGADFYCVVDGIANVDQLARYFNARGLRLKVLIELGVPGGRCGCRDTDEVMALAERIDSEQSLVLSGLEGYEGVVHGSDPERAVRAYAWQLVEAAQGLVRDALFETSQPLITASGSAWYDMIAGVFHEAHLGKQFVPVLRPGCYVVHDHGIYRQAQREVLARRPELERGLKPALEVYAQVVSLPEPGLAVIGMGKRDIGHDQLPEPLRRYREGDERQRPLPVEGWQLTKLMDQHAFITLPPDEGEAGAANGRTRVGDIVAFGVSHPCLTFDKWRRICRVDERLEVIEVMQTCF